MADMGIQLILKATMEVAVEWREEIRVRFIKTKQQSLAILVHQFTTGAKKIILRELQLTHNLIMLSRKMRKMRIPMATIQTVLPEEIGGRVRSTTNSKTIIYEAKELWLLVYKVRE